MPVRGLQGACGRPLQAGQYIGSNPMMKPEFPLADRRGRSIIQPPFTVASATATSWIAPDRIVHLYGGPSTGRRKRHVHSSGPAEGTAEQYGEEEVRGMRSMVRTKCGRNKNPAPRDASPQFVVQPSERLHYDRLIPGIASKNRARIPPGPIRTRTFLIHRGQ